MIVLPRTRVPASSYGHTQKVGRGLAAKRVRLWNAPLRALSIRVVEFVKKPTIYKAFGIAFTLIGVRIFSDIKNARKGRGVFESKKPNAHSGLVAEAAVSLVEEMRCNPAYKKQIAALSEKGLSWLVLDKQGHLFLTSYDGRRIRKTEESQSFPGFVNEKGLKTRVNVGTLLKMAYPYPEALIEGKKRRIRTEGDRIVIINPATREKEEVLTSAIEKKELVDSSSGEKKLVLHLQGKKLVFTLNAEEAGVVFRAISSRDA